MHRVQEWLPICTPYFDTTANFRAEEPRPGSSWCVLAVLCSSTELLPVVFAGMGAGSPPLLVQDVGEAMELQLRSFTARPELSRTLLGWGHGGVPPATAAPCRLPWDRATVVLLVEKETSR